MATKTYRSIYMSRDLELRLEKLAEKEQSSFSRLVRIGVENYLAGLEKKNTHDRKLGGR